MSCRIFILRTMMFVLLVFAAVLAAAPGAHAQEELPQLPPRAAPTAMVGVQSLPSVTLPKLDPARTTAAYLARGRDGSAYFDGGIGLGFLDMVYALVVAGLLLWLRVSTRIRDFAQERTHSRFWQAPIMIVLLAATAAILALPLAAYEGFVRERAYGFSTQSLAGWLSDFAIVCGLVTAGAVLALTPIYAIMRRDRDNWWVGGACIAVLFGILFTVAWPGIIAPLFHHYARLPQGALQQDIDSLARANGVPEKHILVFDESRRSTRMTATTAGLLGSGRIALSDNLLAHAGHDEVMAAAAREIGAYTMGHVARIILLDGLVLLVGFAFIGWGFRHLTDFFGGDWGVRRIDDPAGLPLLVALACVYLLIVTPVTNTIRRTTEAQADLFGLNAARKPDAFADLALRQGDTLKLAPGGWEEMFFYDRPSARTRILEAMRWKAEHLGDPDIRTGPTSPQ